MKKNQDSIDIIKIFNSFRKACINEGFKVIEASFLGRFSFNKFIMWDELNRRKDILANNPLVKSFLEGRKDSSLINKEENINLDKDVSIKDYCIPLSSDSSQIKAIIDSDKKKSYILIGPPGTGKSQTIANIIANSLYKGKKVLFCSEKKAALDVVYNRLKQLRIDPFCLELHSNKQDKREVLKSFDKVLQIGEIKRSEDFDTLTSSYDSLKEELGDLMDKIHLNKNYYISLYDSLVNYSKYKNVEGSIEIDKDLIDNFNENKYESIINLFSKGIDFSHSFNAFKKENPFKILYLDEYSIDIKNNLSILLKETIFKGEKFNYLSKRINKILNIDLLSNESIKSLYEIFDYLDNNKVYLNLLIKDNPKEGINRCIDLLEFENREKKMKILSFQNLINQL